MWWTCFVRQRFEPTQRLCWVLDSDLIVFRSRHPSSGAFVHLSDSEAFLSSLFHLSFLPFVCITQLPLVWNKDSQPQLLGDEAAFAFFSFLYALNHALLCDWVLACWPTFCSFEWKKHERCLIPTVLPGKMVRRPSYLGCQMNYILAVINFN